MSTDPSRADARGAARRRSVVLVAVVVVAAAAIALVLAGSHPPQRDASAAGAAGAGLTSSAGSAPGSGAVLPASATARTHASPITSVGPLHTDGATYSSDSAWWVCEQPFRTGSIGDDVVGPAELARGLPLERGTGGDRDRFFLVQFTDHCEHGVDVEVVPRGSAVIEWTASSDDFRTVAAVVRLDARSFRALRVTEPDGSVLTVPLVR